MADVHEVQEANDKSKFHRQIIPYCSISVLHARCLSVCLSVCPPWVARSQYNVDDALPSTAAANSQQVIGLHRRHILLYSLMKYGSSGLLGARWWCIMQTSRSLSMTHLRRTTLNMTVTIYFGPLSFAVSPNCLLLEPDMLTGFRVNVF